MHWDRPGEGRRGQAGEQGSAWDKKTRPPWAPLYRSVSLAPRTGRPASMNGSLDGTSETLSHHRNFSLFFLVTPPPLSHPAPQLTLPNLVFLSFWCGHDFTQINDHTKQLWAKFNKLRQKAVSYRPWYWEYDQYAHVQATISVCNPQKTLPWAIDLICIP